MSYPCYIVQRYGESTDPKGYLWSVIDQSDKCEVTSTRSENIARDTCYIMNWARGLRQVDGIQTDPLNTQTTANYPKGPLNALSDRIKVLEETDQTRVKKKGN